MKLYSKISVLLNLLTVWLLLSLGIIVERVLSLLHKFIKKQYPDMESTLIDIYQKYTKPQQLAM